MIATIPVLTKLIANGCNSLDFRILLFYTFSKTVQFFSPAYKMKITLLVGLIFFPIATACAATWRCIDADGHQYNSSQSVPVDKCTALDADNGPNTASTDGRTNRPNEKSKRSNPKPGGVFIGMSTEEVRTVGWGRPNSINRTTTAYGVREQWVYGGKNYLYFEDGFLKTIQN